MNRVIFASLGVACFVTASGASAQATRTWVSGVGDDVNPCSRTAPCKTFAGAISKTATNGEINCLDPAGYGSINITKSITIDCGWTHGSILASNVNGVIVNGNGIVVNLRGLSINGAATTTGNGVRILNAAAVNIDDVVIENFGGAGPSNGRGVSIETSGANVRVTIQNSRFWNNNFVGIHAIPTAGNVLLTIDNVQLARGNGTAIDFRQLTTGVVNRTSATNHPNGSGLSLELSSTAASVTNSNFSLNQFGVVNGNAGGAPVMEIYGTVIAHNTGSGIAINGGQVISSGNNIFRGNAGNQTPSSDVGTD